MLKASQTRAAVLGSLLAAAAAVGCGSDNGNKPHVVDPALAAQGKDIFRSDTFGDETFWTDTLMMDKAIAMVDPTTTLTVGLKVDAEALPAAVVAGVMDKSISLTDPATTIALLKLNAVVG